MSKQPQVCQKPIGVILQPYNGLGTGDQPITLYGMKGLREKRTATTITIYTQYSGMPLLIVYIY